MPDVKPYESLRAVDLARTLVRRWWNLDVEIVDAAGAVPCCGAGAPPGNAYCRQAASCDEGLRRCSVSIRDGIAGAGATGVPGVRRATVHRCHLGFLVVVAPLSLDGRAVCLLAGGALLAAPTPGQESALAAALASFGARFDRGALDTVPVLGSQGLGQLQDLLGLAAEEIEAHHGGGPRKMQRPEPSDESGGGPRFGTIVGESPPMQRLYRLIEKIVSSDATVLIGGESGTGKELVARAIHLGGPRAKRPFVVQNCSAFNDNLLESALFGHVRGAFTGAVRDKKGLFEAAHTGTFFLDEVGDMSRALQTKLLRVLQEGTLTPVGSNTVREVDVRMITATHKELAQMVGRGEFREDLYYRLNVIRVDLPPLRERIEDLPLLIAHLVSKHHRGPGRPPRVGVDVLHAMRCYAWPGNIRELENEIERLIVLSGDADEFTADMLSLRIQEAGARKEPFGARALGGTLKDAVESVEREMIREGLARTHGNKSRVAKDLGISRSSLIAKVQQYGLDRADE